MEKCKVILIQYNFVYRINCLAYMLIFVDVDKDVNMVENKLLTTYEVCQDSGRFHHVFP